MFFEMKKAESFSESDIERRNLIPVFLEHLRIGFIQPRDILGADETSDDFYLARDVEKELLFEAGYLYTREILPQKPGGGIRDGEYPLFEIEFVKTRNDKPKAIEVVFLRTEKRESLDAILSRVEQRT